MVKTNKIFKTSRFLIKEISLKEVNKNYLNWFQDPVVKEMIVSKYLTTDLDKLASYVEQKLAQENCFFFAIFENLHNAHIGNIKYEVDLKNFSAEMGVLIGDKTYRGVGLAGEIMPILEKFLKENFNIKKVILGVSADNNAAHKAYIKNGFRLEESKKNHIIMSKDI